jgi:hypothetical protein
MPVHAMGRAQLVRTPIARAQVGVDLTRGVAAAAFYRRNLSRSTSGERAVVSSSRRPARRTGPTPWAA